MTISSKSWLVRFAYFFHTQQYREGGDRDWQGFRTGYYSKYPTQVSLCKLFWTTVGCILVWTFFGTVIGTLGTFIYKFPRNSGIAGLIFLGVAAFIASVAWFRNTTIADKMVDGVAGLAESPAAELLYGFKHKFCPIIDIKREV